MPDRETENQVSALPLWPEQYQYFRLTIYAPVFIFSFRTLNKAHQSPPWGLWTATDTCAAALRSA